MFWLRNKEIIFLLHTLNLSPAGKISQEILRLISVFNGYYSYFIGSCHADADLILTSVENMKLKKKKKKNSLISCPKNFFNHLCIRFYTPPHDSATT